MTHNIQETTIAKSSHRNPKLRNQPIGIFDSGVGGLTVVAELIRQLPGECFVYFGDTARVPYGTKSPETILRMTRENITFLKQFDIKMIVIACHSASCIGESILTKEQKDLPVLGVVKPGISGALAQTRNQKIGLIGTSATIQSQSYAKLITDLNQKVTLFGQATPLLVPLVEEGWLEGSVTEQIVRTYLDPLLAREIDTLILGCTHYPLLAPVIKKVVGKAVTLIDSAEETVKALKAYLTGNDLLAIEQKFENQYYVSDDPEKFCHLGSSFLRDGIKNIQRIRW